MQNTCYHVNTKSIQFALSDNDRPYIQYMIGLPFYEQKENTMNIIPVRDLKIRNHEFSYSPIYEYEVLLKGQRAFENLFLIVHYYLSTTLKNIFCLAFSF